MRHQVVPYFGRQSRDRTHDIPTGIYRPTLRNWWPLFYWFIYVVYMNIYCLYILYINKHSPGTQTMSYVQFRIAIYLKLLQNSTNIQLICLQMTSQGSVPLDLINHTFIIRSKCHKLFVYSANISQREISYRVFKLRIK